MPELQVRYDLLVSLFRLLADGGHYAGYRLVSRVDLPQDLVVMAGRKIDIRALSDDWPEGSFGEDGKITGIGARALHEQLCRLSGMTADQIIADWNEKSEPDDQW